VSYGQPHVPASAEIYGKISENKDGKVIDLYWEFSTTVAQLNQHLRDLIKPSNWKLEEKIEVRIVPKESQNRRPYKCFYIVRNRVIG
jgi:hypothetical protein